MIKYYRTLPRLQAGGPLKILIIRLSAIGDVVHCLPAAAILKRACPCAEISWVVEPMSAELIINNPSVDRAIVFPGKVWLGDLTHPVKWLGTVVQASSFLLG